MKRTYTLWTIGLATLLAGCQQNRMASTRTAAMYPPPMYSRLRIKTDPLPETRTIATMPTSVPAAAAPAAQPAVAQPAVAQPAISHGYVTETPAVDAPHGTTPANTRPTEASRPPQAPAARPATLPAPVAPSAPSAPTAPTVPAEPRLPPPPVPSSGLAPGTSKGHVDPDDGEKIIVMSQSDSSANQSLVLVKNQTKPAPAALVNASHSAPREGVCTITGEAQQYRRSWRLRYAPLDAEDAHGGSVALVGEGLDRIREGQHIRVVGIMRPAEDRGDAPTFEVQFLEVLSR